MVLSNVNAHQPSKIATRLHLRRPNRRTLALLLAPIGVLLTTAGQCDPPASYYPCSPSYTSPDVWGTADISQNSSGAQIVYSLYSSFSDADSNGKWIVSVYMDGGRDDQFTQTGNPVGHLFPQQYVRAGGIFEVSGEVNWTHNGTSTWQRFKAMCRS